jgi:hypothetical protein
MVVSFKKAGEAAVKTVVSAAAKRGSRAPIVGTKPLRPLRALTPDEAPEYAPHNTPNTHSLMPWRGWFQRWLKETVGEERFAKFRSTLFFDPNDIYDLVQSPDMSKDIPISKTDPTITHRYRTPSPGSQAPARVPEFEANEDPYDTGYFKKDTRRRYLSEELGNPEVEKIKLELMDPTGNNELVREEVAKIEAGPISSQGNKGMFATGPTSFDPTGLRSTMSVSWTALEKSLDEHMPDHLPTPVWVGQEHEIVAWHNQRKLPVPVGGYYQALKVPVERRVARW